jgi:hypothetical protein
MKKRIKWLAKKSGFVLWEENQNNQTGSVVDWSSDYDKELKNFFYLTKSYSIHRYKQSLINFIEELQKNAADEGSGYEKGFTAALEAVKAKLQQNPSKPNKQSQ